MIIKSKSQPLPLAVYLLSLCQALMMSSTALMMTISALVGFELADDKSLATLPLSAQFLGLMLTSIPASLIMGRFGRRTGFIIGSLFGIAGAGIAVISILNHQYWWFVFSAFFIGIFNGFGTYYRFAAVDVVDDETNRPKAISYVMLGGVVAAFVGPNLTTLGKSFFTDEVFAGAFVFSIIFYSLVFLIQLFIKIPLDTPSELQGESRPLTEIAKQPTFIVAVVCGMLGYAGMSYLMTATPLAMKHHAHVLSDTSFVIQWHLLAMFAPSFFTGRFIQRFGLLNIMLVGVLFGLSCVAINLVGNTVWHFWVALVVLGISWNFLFISATSLLTRTYRVVEKAKAQAFNDFLVFSLVTVSSLSAGIFQHSFGWRFVNFATLPLFIILLISLIWLKRVPEEKRVSL